MRCNKKNTLAALTSVAILAMPIAAHAQALGVRAGLGLSGTAGTGTSTGGINVGGLTTGLTGLGSTLGNTVGGVTSTVGGLGGLGSLTSGSSLAPVTIPSITTTGLVAANTGNISANVLGGGSVVSATLSPISANVADGLVTLGTPGVGATVLGNGSVANVTTGGPLVVNIGRSRRGTGGPLDVITDPTGPGGLPPVTLGGDSFFSGNIMRVSGGGGGGGGASANANASADSGGGENSTQVCERVLRRPGSFQSNVVQQCRRVVAQLTRRR